MNHRTLLSIAALALLLSASAAEAKPGSTPTSSGSYGHGAGQNSLSFWGVFDPGSDGAGLGMRLALPIAPQGILHAKVRDEFVLELGADFLHYSEHVGGPYYTDYSWNGFLLVGGVAWNFWFTPQLALYPKLDLGWWFGSYNGWDPVYGTYYHQHEFDGLFLQGAVGLIYRFSKVDLRVELGSGLLRVGVGIPF